MVSAYYVRNLSHALKVRRIARHPKRAVALLTFFGGIGGFLFGYDTGVISGALPYLRDDLLQSYAADVAR